MIDQLVLDFKSATAGRILHIPPSWYMTTIGWNFCDAGRADGSNMDWRAYFSFDTSPLPDHAQIDEVSFRVRRRDDPAGEPQYYSLKFSIGTFIGPTLDGNAAEWTAGALMVTLSSKPADKTTLDLSADGQDPCPHVNKTGDTDIKIWDASTKGTGDDVWSTNFNQFALTGCKLYVTYSVPSATATGNGSASCSAAITANATIEATGVGTLSCSASVIVSATASATGVGDCEAAAAVIRSGSATATGIGDCEAAAAMIYSASATATGIGYASAAAVMIYSGSATATGIGYASAAGGIVPEPLAIHYATIAVASVDTASFALVSRDDATIAVDSDDVATRGQRRN